MIRAIVRHTFLKGQRGSLLLDSLVAVSILSLVFTALLAGTSLAARSTSKAHEVSTGSWLSRSQIELVRDAAYLAPPMAYPVVSPHAGYTVENSNAPYPGGDPDIQLVTIRVLREGNLVLETEILKVNR